VALSITAIVMSMHEAGALTRLALEAAAPLPHDAAACMAQEPAWLGRAVDGVVVTLATPLNMYLAGAPLAPPQAATFPLF
jgi:hypothetical protein